MPTLEEKKQKLETQIAQKNAQLNKLKNQQRRQERAARTRRLIQHGALAEKYLNCTGMATNDFENLLADIVAIEDIKALLQRPNAKTIAAIQEADELIYQPDTKRYTSVDELFTDLDKEETPAEKEE